MPQIKHSPKTVLTIAGSDPSGGAGIQADIKTIAALDCYGLSVLTALTAQNTKGIMAIHPVEQSIFIDQFRAIFNDINVDAIKIGMLGSASLIRTLAALLRNLPVMPPVILDTVLGSSSGTSFLDTPAQRLMLDELFPIATLVTPNIPEAMILSGHHAARIDRPAMVEMGNILMERAPQAVLIKGGHLDGEECADYLLMKNRTTCWFSSERIKTRNTHGTGCTLSAAIACFVAEGASLPDAVHKGRQYLLHALVAGQSMMIGCGTGPMQHFFNNYQEKRDSDHHQGCNLGTRPIEK